MPIKFRCTHCNQFLGISRSQSGSIVDCPSCGRSIRVPDLDGTVAPLPRPAIDLSDNSLASALEQLAALELGVSQDAVAAEPDRVGRPPVVSTPPVISVPAEPIVASLSDAPSFPHESKSRPWLEVEEQLAALANDAPRRSAPRAPAFITRRDLLVASVSAATMAPITWWLTRRSHGIALPHVAQDAAPARDAKAAPDAPATDPAAALTGRITYRTADGESRPDAGTRVLLFPENRQGSTLLSVDGFRSNAAAADLQLARESMKLYGGAYVIADEQGRYGADLSSSGTYEILIISNYQSRPAGPLPPDLLKALGRYFDRPQQLIGQTAYEFAHFRFTGRETAVRDHVFQRV